MGSRRRRHFGTHGGWLRSWSFRNSSDASTGGWRCFSRPGSGACMSTIRSPLRLGLGLHMDTVLQIMLGGRGTRGGLRGDIRRPHAYPRLASLHIIRLLVASIGGEGRGRGGGTAALTVAARGGPLLAEARGSCAASTILRRLALLVPGLIEGHISRTGRIPPHRGRVGSGRSLSPGRGAEAAGGPGGGELGFQSVAVMREGGGAAHTRV